MGDTAMATPLTATDLTDTAMPPPTLTATDTTSARLRPSPLTDTAMATPPTATDLTDTAMLPVPTVTATAMLPVPTATTTKLSNTSPSSILLSANQKKYKKSKSFKEENNGNKTRVERF